MKTKVFARYVSLNIGGMMGMSLYILVDTFFVSLAVGADGLAALNLAITAYSVVVGMGQLFGVGGATDFALRRSRGESGRASFGWALALSAVCAALFLLLALFGSGPLSLLLGADEITYPLTRVYLKTLLCFSPFLLFTTVLQAFVRNDGAPNLSMLSMLVSSFANIILDYVFMFPLGLGMFGAAFATGISSVLGLCVMLPHLRSPRCTLKLSRTLPSPRELLSMLSCGMSAFVGEMASAVSLLTFNLILMRIGGYVAVAAYGIVANVALVATSIFTGVGQGIQPLASRAYGTGGYADLRKLTRMTLVTALALAGLLYAIVFAFTPQIAAVFDSEHTAGLLDAAVPGLRIYFAGYFFACVNVAAAALLSAVSRPAQALCVSLLRSCVLLVPAALVMSALWGLTGVWSSYVLTEAVVLLLSALFLARLYRAS